MRRGQTPTPPPSRGGGVQLHAHSSPNRPPAEWHTLDEHLDAVANMAAAFAAAFQSSDWAFNAGLLHDLGKADPAFQGYLKRRNGLDDDDCDGGRVNHSTAGAAFAEEVFDSLAGRVLAYLAAGHHAGLPDWHATETGRAALSVRMREGKENLNRARGYAEKIRGKLFLNPRPPEFARKPERVHLWMRMLHSCLVDADFLDTEAFMDRQKAELRAVAESAALPLLKAKLDAHLEMLAASAPKTPVNAIRQEILAACRAAVESAPGLFSLTVPTGGGKTLSSMAFALDHAVRHGKDRVIYVIPHTSIIEQTAAILRSVFGDEHVVEHHSDLDPERETPRAALAAENWDAPVVVTTNVQFFESLYAAKSSRCRKLHNIVNSVVILDEAQLLPPALLSPCVDAMDQLTRDYGVTMVLATATQPALSDLPPPCPKLAAPREIIPPELKLYERLRRTVIHFPADLRAAVEWPELAERLQRHDQVLCVVNTRRDCHDLFKLMPRGTIHLSALMCGEHRSEVIAEIKRRLAANEPCRVISTQLVEAGVDIDFPVVYRALAGLDSIAQAAGRCNREGRLNTEDKLGHVHVFVPPRPAPLGLLRKGEDTTRELAASAKFSPDSPAEHARYFKLFYGRINDTGGAFKEWLVKNVLASTAADCLKLAFRTAAANFKLIDDEAQRPVVVRHGDSDKWIDQLCAKGPTRWIMRRLQRHTVNLPTRVVETMLANGLLEEVCDGILAQAMPDLYSQDLGFDVFRESLPAEGLVQ